MVHVSFAANLQSTSCVPNRIAAFRCELPKAWSFNVLVARHGTGWEPSPSSWWLSWFMIIGPPPQNKTKHQIAQWKHQLPCSHMQPSWWQCRHPVGMGCWKVSRASSTWCPILHCRARLRPCVWRSWNSASWGLHVLIDRESTHVHSMDWIEVTECWIHLSVMIHKQAETCHSSCFQNNSLQSGHKLHSKDVFRTC